MVHSATAAYDIIIVGGGPVGLTLANLLGPSGLRVLILEKDRALPDQPRAVALDDECLRIWQQCGLIDHILPFVAQGDEGDKVFTYRRADNQPIFSLEQHGRPFGYARGNVFLYHQVLAELLTGLQRYSSLDYRPGHEVTALTQNREQAAVTVLTSDGSNLSFSCRYLVGCDGGRSSVRDLLGISLQGMAYEESWLIVDTFNPDRADRPLTEGVEVWCDASCPTATIPLPAGYRRWEFLLRKKRYPDPPQCLDDAFIRNLIKQRKPDSDGHLVRTLVHTYKARIADRYRDGRVFLAGDAAHLSPPFAGQGMATGLRDAQNLFWKLVQVLSGKEDTTLLDSYQGERRPHQQKMLALALRMGRMMMPQSRLHAWLVSALFDVAEKIVPVRKLLEIRGQNVTPVYGPVTKGSRQGQLLPQPQLPDGRLFDTLLGPDYTLISFGINAVQGLSDIELASWRARGLTMLHIPSQGDLAEVYSCFDQWLRGCAERLLIVRPDRFVCLDRKR